MFKRNATLFCDKPALIFYDEVVTFGELLSQIQSLSGGLCTQGIQKTDRIAVLSQNNCKVFQLYGAVAAMGAIVVPINWRLSGEEIQKILLDSAPTTIFLDEIYMDMISQLRPKCKSLKKFFVFGNPVGNFGSFDGLMNNYPTEEVEVKGNDPYMLIYTTAMDGKPRGAILSHNNVIFCNMQTIGMMGLTYRDNYLNILPLFHVVGFAMALSLKWYSKKLRRNGLR
jgi:long-chain acyl-CoA synthetase